MEENKIIRTKLITATANEPMYVDQLCEIDEENVAHLTPYGNFIVIQDADINQTVLLNRVDRS